MVFAVHVYAVCLTGTKSLKHSNQVIQIINETVKRNLRTFSFGRAPSKNVFTGKKKLNTEISKMNGALTHARLQKVKRTC